MQKAVVGAWDGGFLCRIIIAAKVAKKKVPPRLSKSVVS